MTAALVCLDTDTGMLRRYGRGPGGFARFTNLTQFVNWEAAVLGRTDWSQARAVIEEFRTAPQNFIEPGETPDRPPEAA